MTLEKNFLKKVKTIVAISFFIFNNFHIQLQKESFTIKSKSKSCANTPKGIFLKQIIVQGTAPLGNDSSSFPTITPLI
jgi:hypothetical protein